MPRVVFSISAGGKDVTANISPILTSMTVTDVEGFQSDNLQLVLDDVDGAIDPPTTGVILNPIGGYEGRIRDFGLFSVDSVTYSGWPQQVTISAQSTIAKAMSKQKDPKSYPRKKFPTYGDIFADVAKAIGLPLAISDAIRSLPNPGEFQAEEDGREFLTRIGEKLAASVTAKAGRLVVVKKGAGQSASGASLPIITIRRGVNLLSYSMTEKDEPKYSEVEATHYDRAKNERKTVKEPTGLEGPKFALRAPQKDEADAKQAAKARAEDLKRAQAEASFTIDGDPFAMAEAIARVVGVRRRVDRDWKVKQATHTFSGSAAYTTELQCEVPLK